MYVSAIHMAIDMRHNTVYTFKLWRIDLDDHIRSRINQSIATACRKFWSCKAFVNCIQTEDTAVGGAVV